MRIIPVIDLMAGQVVRGVAGQRAKYRPIKSALCESSLPAEVARALVARFGFDELYVADLDAIAGHEPAWQVYRELATLVPGFMVDAGIHDAAQAKNLADFRPICTRTDCDGHAQTVTVVAGLESVPSPGTLVEMLAGIGHERLVFSLDMKLGQPLTDSPGWKGRDALGIARTVVDLGVRRMIVLDLARVGMDCGVGTEVICRQLHDANPDMEIIGGGGVRGMDDLRSLTAAGCDGALVASALHDGRLSVEEVRENSQHKLGE